MDTKALGHVAEQTEEEIMAERMKKEVSVLDNL